MAVAEQCKEIELGIKHMLKIKDHSDESHEATDKNSDSNYNPGIELQGKIDKKSNSNHNPFSVDGRCFVSDIEKLSLFPQNPSFAERTSVDNSVDNASASDLIDLNVLKDFAARHITSDTSFSSSDMVLNSNDTKLPHPDLEDDYNLEIKNGEQPNILNFLNTVAKEIESSPHFLSMPENPLPQISERSQELIVGQSFNSDKTSVDSKPKDGNDMKNDPKKKKLTRRQMKELKKKETKERMDGLFIKKSETVKKQETNEDGSDKSPVESNDIKAIEKKPVEPSDKFPDIKLKKNALASVGKEYSLMVQDMSLKFLCHICNHSAEKEENIKKHLSSKAHMSLKWQNDLDMILPFLPEPLPCQVEALNDLLIDIAAKFGLKKEDMDIRSSMCLKLNQFIETHLPTCSVSLVGSSMSGFGLKDSEVDYILQVVDEENIPDCLENLYNLLLSDKAYKKVESDFKKKRPCIKYIDVENSLLCHVLIESGSATKLAKLLSFYFQLDQRVPTLGIALRYWAKLCKIDQQNRGTLPSCCFPLFLIHFLQQVQPPVLPVLHEIEGFGPSEFFEKFSLENNWKSENTDSIGELWLKFFHFYSFDYKVGQHVVCIRSSKRVTCKDRNWSTRFFAVEEPYTRRNLAYVIPTFPVCQYIHQCFIKTYRYFAFPRSKSKSIELIKNESFDALTMSEYAVTEPDLKDLEESEESENEDSDQLVDNPELEDHDPEISVDSFVSTMKKISLNNEDDADGAITSSEKSSDIVLSTTDISSSPKKSTDKSTKENQTKHTLKPNSQSVGYWDTKGKEITKEMFHYEFRAVTFKGERDVPLQCKLCKGSGHLKKDCPNDDLPIPISLPSMTPEFLNLIDEVLHNVKDATLQLFGSFCNGFGFKNKSDMDFCLTFGDRNDSKNLDSILIIEKIAEVLRKHPQLENILPITSAKVPIVKFSWRTTRLEGDISLYNTLALVNTEMLEAYTKIDPRVQVLGYALKHFAKVLGICDASRGSLSSYAYILMVLYFLQQRNPPVIPVLQELYRDEKPSELVDEKWNVYFFRDLDKLTDVWPDYGKNKESVGELWLGLLSFYTCDFNWKEYVISIRQKKPLLRFKKLWNTDQLAIEDPFDLDHNLGAGLSRKMNSYILKAFMKARERFGCPIPIEKLKYGQAYLFNRQFLNSGVEPPQDRGCGNCGKIGHIARNCPHEKICSYCRKPGHLIKNCPRKKHKKSRERDQNQAYDKANTERKGSNDRRNSRAKNDYHTMPFQGMQPQGMPSRNDLFEVQKLAQMGIPAHRLVPPGFQARNIIPKPPPGFNATPMPQPPINYPPPFINKHPSATPPFPRGGKQNDLHAHSPPKLFSSSPPKNFPPNKNAFHHVQEPPWPAGRQGFQVDRHLNPQLSRSLPSHPLHPGHRNMQVERHHVPHGPRNFNPSWQNRPFPPKDHMPHPNQPHNLDHRLNRTNSDNSYNSNHGDRW
ncbi:Terminal uridylyltransferase 4 like protein [Argiope bruennichi]|uniref:Terminal uridylyltransferase 4 like protein n=1 Tax=Argiope bruennichi TaxID=94029 RepID=A0A8T0E8S0_ARGBR|nr:Terminal uridylyltransferase 4 like protein [Argiope bruennichi]